MPAPPGGGPRSLPGGSRAGSSVVRPVAVRLVPLFRPMGISFLLARSSSRISMQCGKGGKWDDETWTVAPTLPPAADDAADGDNNQVGAPADLAADAEAPTSLPENKFVVEAPAGAPAGAPTSIPEDRFVVSTPTKAGAGKEAPASVPDNKFVVSPTPRPTRRPTEAPTGVPEGKFVASRPESTWWQPTAAPYAIPAGKFDATRPRPTPRPTPPPAPAPTPPPTPAPVPAPTAPTPVACGPMFCEGDTVCVYVPFPLPGKHDCLLI